MPRVLLLRAGVRRALKDVKGAEDDEKEALTRTPHDDLELLYHDGRRRGRTNASSFGSLRLPAAAHTRLIHGRRR